MPDRVRREPADLVFLRRQIAESPAKRRQLEAAIDHGVSLSKYLGREPSERHDHFDADGNLTGYTIVTRESEFTDSDRDHVAALAEVRANECPKCGGPLDQTTDAHVAWKVEYDECNRCETVAYTQARDSGDSDSEARKQARPAGRLWRATAVPNP
jgi:hypothetical protein